MAVLFGDVGVLLERSPGPAETVEGFLLTEGVVRSPDVVRAALGRALERVEGTNRPLPSARWTTADRPIAHRLFHELALDEDADALADSLCGRDEIIGDWIPAPGAIAALEILRRAGVSLAVVSSLGDSLRPTLEATGLLRFFEQLVHPDDTGLEGRMAGMLRRALDGLGTAPDRSWYVGLASDDAAEPARRAGCKLVLIDPAATTGHDTEDVCWRARRADQAARLLLDAEGLDSA